MSDRGGHEVTEEDQPNKAKKAQAAERGIARTRTAHQEGAHQARFELRDSGALSTDTSDWLWHIFGEAG